MKGLLQKICTITILLAFSLGLSAQINAEFSVNNASGCSPLVVIFTDQSTGNPTNWRWDFGNTNGSIQQNPSAIYMVPGQYTVRLIASGPSGIDTVIKTQLITVFRNPEAKFVASDTIGCAPAAISFADISAPGDAPINSWLWDFGDGTTSSQQNPNHTYTSPGVYTVTLLTRDANGCRNEFTRTDYITIMPKPTAAFTGTPNNGCNIPHTVTFNNTTTGGSGFTYQWTFGDGATSTQQNPSHTYTTGGTYTVRLIATNSAGCSDTLTRTNYVNINNIVADFSVNRINPCVGQNVRYTSNSPGAVWWRWDFGDGNTSNFEEPNRSYSSSGLYTVTLVVRNSNGCYDTITRTDYIDVRPRPITNFTATPTVGCEVPFTVQFNNTTVDGVSYEWEFGDGNTSTAQNPSHTYTSPGTYTVRLVATGANGCRHTRTRTDYINIQLPNVAFTANVREGCIPLAVQFTDQSSANSGIVGWDWDFGDGNTSTAQNPSHTYTTVGIFDVTLTITTASGCTRTITYPQYIRAGEQPTIEFTATPRQTCLFFPVNFTDQSTPADFWYWQFGDGGTSFDQNPIYQYGDTGLFTVTLIVGENGCFDTLIKPDYIRIFPPRASFTTLYTCADPYTVNFTNTSLGGHVWLWKFGTGDTAITRDASYTFPSRGDYTVTLTVWDTIGGCLDSTQALIQVRDPIAAFAASDTVGCVNHVVTFTNTATDAFFYEWDFGNGQTSNNANPTVTYNTPGVYTVRLIVRDIHNCADTFIRPNYITALGAFADFNADTLTGCTPLNVQYNDLSTSFMGNIVAWDWDLGAGQTSNQQNPTGYYTVPGNYTIRLTVTDDNGCSNTLSRINFIVPTYPTPAFYTDDTLVCLGGTVDFVNTSIGSGLTYFWDFGDGNNSTDANPTHTYADTGRYNISLQVTDINGCDSTTIRNQYIHVVQPTASFVTDTLAANCPPLLVNFANQSSADVTNWSYDFGNGSISNLENPAHIYNAPGVYYPTLTITNSIGCTATYNLPDSIVVGGPTGDFTYQQITYCAPFEVEFYAQGTNPAVTHIWDFGDGNVLVDDDTATHYYAIPGTFNPQLILDDQMGCVISLPTISPIFAAIVDADFVSDVTYMCRPGVANFTDLSSGVPGVVSWFWDFGDGSTSTDQNPSHYFASTGSYDITLIATNASGCSDTLIRPGYIRVMDDPTALFTVNTQNACFPATINFTNQSTADTTFASIMWVFDDGTTSTQQNPTKTYASPGTYTVQLMVATVMGCLDTFSMPITLFVPPAAAAGVDLSICIGQSDMLSGTGGVSYLWSPATGLSATNIATPVANPTVTTDYVLVVTDSNGCTDTDTVTVTVNPLPTPTATGGTICVSGTAQLNANGGVAYVWDNGATLNDNTIANPTASPVNTTTYTVTVTDANGCVNTAQADVNVNALPTVITSPDATICIGQTSQLTASGGVTYLWSPAATLSDANIANPVATPIVTTTYNVTVTDANGCINYGATTVNVNPLPTVVTSPPAAICIGQSTQLTATGGVTYAWNNAASLSDANIADPIASPTATTTYTVTVTDANGCINTGSTTITVNPLPTPTATGGTICINGSTQLNATGGVSYIWDNAGSLSNATIASPTASPTSTTTYTVTVTDANGCVNTAQAVVNVNPLPTVSMSPDATICIGESSTLSAAGGVTYLWSPAATLSDANIANPVATPIVTTTYNVTVTDANGCINYGATTVNVNPLPTVVTSPPAAICIGQSTQLTATGGVTYAWNNAASLSDANIADPIASPTATTTYTVTVTDANGCINTGSTTITVNPLPTPTATGGTICINGSTQLNATGGVSYIWDNAGSLSNATIASPTASPTSTTTYTVTVTDANGCVNTAQAVVNVNPLPTVSMSPDATICIGESSTLSAAGGVTYLWSPAATLSDANIANPVATPIVTTTYNVTVTDANGCINYGATTVNVNPLPTVVTSPPVAICIGQSTQLTATGGVTYAWSNAASLSNANIADPIASPTATTTYTVTVTDANGCINTGSTTVTVNPLPVVGIHPDTLLCLGESVELYATGGAGYNWGPSAGLNCLTCANPIATPAVNTTYTVVVTNIHGCVDSSQVRVDVNTVEARFSTSDTTACVPTTVQFNDLSVADSSIVAWSWIFGDGGIDSIQNPSYTYTVAGVYTAQLQVTTITGCIDTASLVININALPAVAAGPDRTICVNDTTTLQGTGGVTYLWSPANTLSDATIAAPLAYPTSTTIYNLTVTDANGCQGTSEVQVNVNPLPIITTTPSQQLCNGEVLQLNATGGIDYLWTPAAGLSCTTCPNPIANPFSPNGFTHTYSVQVTDTNGCISTGSTTITRLLLPVIDMSPDTTICFGSTVEISGGGTPFYNYLWSPAVGLACDTCSTTNATPDTTTTYTLTATNTNGCSRTEEVTITVNQLPVVTTSPDTAICHGEVVELTANGGTNFVWTPSQGITCSNACNMVMAAPDSSTTYSVLVTDPNGCQASGEIDVIVYQLDAEFNLSDTSVCTPQIVTLTDQSTGDNPIASWLWVMADGGLASTQNTTVTYNTPGNRDIVLQVIDSYGCIDTSMQVVEMLPTPVAVAGPDTAICFGETAQLQGTGGQVYFWSGGVNISDPNIANPTVKPASATEYYLRAEFSNGCFAFDTILVDVNPLPIPSITGDTVACFGDSLRFEATGGTDYIWSPSQGLTTATQPNTTAYASQDITYTVVVTDTNGCAAIDSIVLKVNPVPAIVVSPDVEICLGESVNLEVTGAVEYGWGPNQDISCLDCASPVANPTETTNYVVVGYNEFGCSTIDDVNVVVRPLPTVQTIEDVTMCSTETLELTTTATGATGFNWTANGQPDATLQSPSVTPSASTIYVVEAFNQYGCTDNDTVNVNVIETILATVSDDAVICDGQNVNLRVDVLQSGLADYVITWLPEGMFNNPNRNAQTFTPTESMNVQVAISGGDCVVDTQNISVTVNSLPTVDIGPDRVVLMGEYITLDANATGNIATYYWSPNDSLNCTDCENVNFNAWGSNTYNVFVTDANGCTAEDDVNIRVLTTCEQDIFIPNSFSPNRDGNNDILYVRSHSVEQIRIFRIFDRWGNLVFETNDINQGWNGLYRNSMVDPGVFVYYLEGTCPNGGDVFLKGNVTVIR